MSAALVVPSDGPLVDRISTLIEQTRSTVATRVNSALTLMNWHIGRMIQLDVLREQRADYGREIVASLGQQLSWTHIKALLPVSMPEARQFYIDQAITARLSVRALRELEVGNGWAFVARQKRMTVDNDDFYLDLHPGDLPRRRRAGCPAGTAVG